MRKKKKERIGYDKELNYRSMTLSARADGMPETINTEDRSVEVVGATETPVDVYDWSRMEIIPEILLMSGCQIPKTRQITLLDTHSRWDTRDIIGSFREMAIEGKTLIGRAYFSTVGSAEEAYTKIREGHLTDFSVGYRVQESQYIPEGETQKINGRDYTGPLKVATLWTPKELSACPVGADENAKARAADTHNIGDKTDKTVTKEEEKMNERIRKHLESRGLSESATEEEAYKYLETLDTKRDEVKTPIGNVLPIEDTARIEKEAARKEQERVLEIRAMCDQVNQSELAHNFIVENKTIDETRKAVFETMLTNKGTVGGAGYRAPIELVADERDKFRSAAGDSLMIRSGRNLEKPAQGALDMSGFSLREMARECLRFAGKPTNGNPMDMVGRALTTSDFPFILAAAANKSLFEGYDTATETWQDWCGIGQVSDFKTQSSVRASETDDLDEIKEDDEYKYGSRTEAREQYAIATYGKLFSISRQAIINDDLNAITDTPRNHGEAANRKVGDVAYAVLTANSNMGDGVALFHANHGNLGTGAALSETTAAEAIKLMKLQKGLKGKRRLNIRPIFSIAPVALEGSHEVFYNSNMFAGANLATTRVNPYTGSRFTRVFEPRLDDDSATAWYYAGPKGKTVTVFFLNGNQMPYLETKQGWNVDGVEYKVRIDAGAKAMDWKALVKNAGV